MKKDEYAAATPAELHTPAEQQSAFTFGDWVTSDIIPFDKNDEYEKHLVPLVDALMEEAEKRNISLTVLAIGSVNESGSPGTYVSQNLARPCGYIPAEALLIPFVEDVSPGGMDRYAALVGADRHRILRLRDKTTH